MCSPDGNGADFRSKWNLGTRPMVLFIGRRDEGKGFPALLQAWKSVLLQNPGAVLVLAGPGEARALGIPDDSFMDLGVPEEGTKASALAACDIFCLPSAHESFGIVFAEAWSYGKPVICGPAPASREWIQDGVTGLHSTQDPSAVAAAISRLLADSELRSRMGAAGRELQQTRLTWDAVMRIHAQVFASENGC
jgi:glycosyltransferase involved in cell wall biosynthesis